MYISSCPMQLFINQIQEHTLLLNVSFEMMQLFSGNEMPPSVTALRHRSPRIGSGIKDPTRSAARSSLPTSSIFENDGIGET